MEEITLGASFGRTLSVLILVVLLVLEGPDISISALLPPMWSRLLGP